MCPATTRRRGCRRRGSRCPPIRSARSGSGSTEGHSGPTIRHLARGQCRQPRGVPAAPPPCGTRGPNQKLGRNPDRSLHPRPPRGRGAVASPEADKATLLRRVSLDLIGLPPTIEEVDAFLADTTVRRPDEGRRAPARLAALRRTLGPALARRRPLRRLRRLRKRQVALRLVLSRLGHRRVQSRPALRPVHHRATRRRPVAQRHAGPDRRHRFSAQLDDQRGRRHRSRAVPHGSDVRPHGRHRARACSASRSSAAQCHNHKFDPITQEEYYRLFAFLNNDTKPQRRRLHARGADAAAPTCAANRRRSKPSCSTTTPDWPERMATWEKTSRRSQPAWTVRRASKVIEPRRRYPPGRRLASRPGLCADEAPPPRSRSKTDLGSITAFRLELLTDPNLPAQWAGPFVQGDLRAHANSTSRPQTAGRAKKRRSQARQSHGRFRRSAG